MRLGDHPNGLSLRTARGLARAIAAGELSAVDVVARAIRRAENDGPSVGAFVHLTPELALAQARAADALVAAGGALPPLLGVPCPIKDLAQVAGVPFEAGSRALRGNVAAVDDGVVTRLRAAGTIMLGKTTAPEFGFPAYTEPDVAPPARTPWDLTRSAGGSSGGAAAAVASGIVPIAHGSDAGGSLRIPAGACGLVGMKPSRGRVSAGPWRVDGPGLASDGVLTTDIRDTALGLDVLAGAEPGDAYWVPAPRTSFLAACDAEVPRLRIGVLTLPAIVAEADVHPEALAGVDQAVRALVGLGHDVVEAPRPFEPQRWTAFQAVWAVAAASLPLPVGSDDLLVPLTRWLRELGRRVTGAQYAAALAGIQSLARDVARTWAAFDAVLTPTLAQPPAPIGSLRDDADPEADFAAQCRYTPWTSVANLTGRPSISLPLHRAFVDGVELPFGVMLTGRPAGDEQLLAVSTQLEAAKPWIAEPTGDS